MQFRTTMRLTVRTVVAALMCVFQPFAERLAFTKFDWTPMNIGLKQRGCQRAARALALSILGLCVLAQPALAARPGHTMQRFLTRGPQAVPSGEQTPTAGAQYGLFNCQVVGVSQSNCIDPYEMRHAYQVDSLIAQGYDGRGQTIAIVDAFQHPNLVAQMATFDAFYGLPAVQLTQVAPDGLTPFNPADGNMVGWAEEISLDVEWAHAIAPGAKIVLVLAKTNNDDDIVSALNYAINQSLGNVISMSFGENESCLGPALTTVYHNAFAAATAKHITLIASSADQGAALSTCDGNSWVKAVSSPASDPLVTGVGGTELTVAKYCLASRGCDPSTHAAAGTYLSETAWNEGLPYGDYGNVFGFGTLSGGGGFSVVYGEPPYQEGVLHGGKHRAVPDVSYSAAVEHGVLTYLAIPGIPNDYYLFGGTSAGAPQWAAITAIADQRAGTSLGFLNTALYHIAEADKAYETLFHDVTVGNNSSLQFDSVGNPVNIIGFNAGTGWDAATGVGSPKTPGIVDQLLHYVSPGDATAVLANTKPKPNEKAVGPSSVKPH
jgi:subtilase family serine protease